MENDRLKQYSELNMRLEALFETEHDWLANAANFCAEVYHTLDRINWCGFYMLKGTELVLGPFQGKAACVRIQAGRGVCGTAADRRQTIVVADVHQFPGHIACDGESKSEIVIPLIKSDKLIGVLDIDSPEYNRFTDEDRTGLEQLARVYLAGSYF